MTTTCPVCGGPKGKQYARCIACSNKARTGTRQPYTMTAYERKQVQYQRYPERINARNAVRRAVGNGRLVRGVCADCGDAETYAHHWHGYGHEHWLDVIWLCRECHRVREGRTNPAHYTHPKRLPPAGEPGAINQ